MTPRRPSSTDPRFRTERAGAVTRASGAGLLTRVTAVSIAAASASACHHAVAHAHTQPAPAVRAIAVAGPTLTDRQWIDSVAQSWAGQQPAVAESGGAPPARVRASWQPAATVAAASSAPTTSATSYAEAASEAARVPATDDHAPLIVVCAIGAAAFLIAVASARVAFGG
jgi:hypothetical protein